MPFGQSAALTHSCDSWLMMAAANLWHSPYILGSGVRWCIWIKLFLETVWIHTHVIYSGIDSIPLNINGFFFAHKKFNLKIRLTFHRTSHYFLFVTARFLCNWNVVLLKKLLKCSLSTPRWEKGLSRRWRWNFNDPYWENGSLEQQNHLNNPESRREKRI